MGLALDYTYGQTALSEEETEGLRILSITTREELDQFEQQNIEDAISWTLGKNWKLEKLLSESFIKQLHMRMYGQVWRWAGTYRLSDKNLGVPYYEIHTALRQLLDDARYWHEHQVYEPIEQVLRFKHRLVSIHCFPNGNGRHSRLMADIIIEKLFDLPVFSWGGLQLIQPTEIRKKYIDSLKTADSHNIEDLISFAQS